MLNITSAFSSLDLDITCLENSFDNVMIICALKFIMHKIPLITVKHSLINYITVELFTSYAAQFAFSLVKKNLNHQILLDASRFTLYKPSYEFNIYHHYMKQWYIM